MQSIPLLPLLRGTHWRRLLAPDWVLSMGQIKLFDIKTVYLGYTEFFGIELFLHLTV